MDNARSTFSWAAPACALAVASSSVRVHRAQLKGHVEQGFLRRIGELREAWQQMSERRLEAGHVGVLQSIYACGRHAKRGALFVVGWQHCRLEGLYEMPLGSLFLRCSRRAVHSNHLDDAGWFCRPNKKGPRPPPTWCGLGELAKGTQ